MPRILIASNRLPFTLNRKGKTTEFKPSSGGLISGINSFLEKKQQLKSTLDHIWFGWAGQRIDKPYQEEIRHEALKKRRSYPIYLSDTQVENYYNGFCNNLIWPLFHYFPSLCRFDPRYWQDYQAVNRLFAEAILKVDQKDDLIWIHDFHLMLLPKLIRAKRPQAKIGFFLHTPFPSFEVFRLLPKNWREEILSSLLNADLVGFHTPEYSQYFLQSVLQILGHTHSMGRLQIDDRQVSVKSFPIGVDVDKFIEATKIPAVKEERKRLKKRWGANKTILSLDRLDYTKGILNRLLGFELFLDQNPTWHQKIQLILILVPSRVEVEHYQQMKRQIEESVGQINGRFGGIEWTPIIYQFDQVPFEKLVALYQQSDIALVTPLRDGMNLVAKEYLASRTDESGVLILSELAGSAKELREAVIVNPNSIQEIADSLELALTMPQPEQIRRNQLMQNRIQSYNVIRWAQDFLAALTKVKSEQSHYEVNLLNSEAKNQIRRHYLTSRKRLLLLDYDGTLVSHLNNPLDAWPSPKTLRLIKHLEKDPRNKLVILSGRDCSSLERFLAPFKVGLAAEHGLFIKEIGSPATEEIGVQEGASAKRSQTSRRGSDWRLVRQYSNQWKSAFYHLLRMYVARLPGSFTEEKEYSLAWHYRQSAPAEAEKIAKELVNDLTNLSANQDLNILHSNKVIEIKNASVHKGNVASHFLIKANYDFVLAIGDDATDEDLFNALPKDAYTIKVGLTQSIARFNLVDQTAVLPLLEAMAYQNSLVSS